MKFSHETLLERPIDVVWKAFDNPENLKIWMPTVTKFELISGEQGRPGAISRLTFVENGRTIVMDEIVHTRNEPFEFTGEYNAGFCTNKVGNRFESAAGGQTKWTMDTEFVFTGFFRIFAPLMKGMFKKRVVADCARFKEKLESGALTV